MLRKAIVFFTSLAFSFSCFSCYTTTIDRKWMTSITEREISNVQIAALRKYSGETINFYFKQLGKVEQGAIVGAALKGKRKIDKDNIEKIILDKDKITAIVTKDGERISKPPFEEEEWEYSFIDYEMISIPIYEVEFVEIRRKTFTKFGKTVMLCIVLAPIVAAAAVGLLYLAFKAASCPSIYSYDGERYIFDAEPYGGAVCEGLKRMEWCELEHIKEVDGQYKIMITNELEETQYIDELKLLVVDHPKSVKVIPSVTGELHCFSHPISPARAFDGRGKDLLDLVSEKDMSIWQTQMKGRNPDRLEDLRDELVFEFPRPKGAERVKLWVDACTTLWGSYMIKQSLELFGWRVDTYYDEIDRRGRAYQELWESTVEREMYVLKIRVKCGDKWVTKGLVHGGGPFISEDKAYVMDIGDVQGETLTIKLIAPANFWMINYLAVDYSDDVSIETEELRPYRVVSHDGQDIENLLSEEDGIYHVMPKMGDWAELTFSTPKTDSSLARTVFVKASGYYDIHLERKGMPRYLTLWRFKHDTDFPIRYSLKSYLEWQQEMEREFAMANH